MSDSPSLKPEFLISDEESLRALYPERHTLAVQKCQNQLDKHSIEFIKRSPFLCLGTQNKDGSADVSPRGDPAGFVKILDSKNILIPDRPGNNRLDSLSNITSNPNVGLLFIIPGFDDTMRINGVASLTCDPELMALMSVRDRAPTIAVHVQVNEVFIHCAKAFRRSKLWDPDSFQDRGDFPSLANVILDQTSNLPDDLAELDKIDAEIEHEYKTTLY